MDTTLDIVIPVLNEEGTLSLNVERLMAFLSNNMADYNCQIIIADNGSTDATPDIAESLAIKHHHVNWLRLEERGRGLALRTAWLQSSADIVAYMDVDLSTDLMAMPDLIGAIRYDDCAVALGSRLARGARVMGRPRLREGISRVYSFIFRVFFPEMFGHPLGFSSWFLSGFQDAQCGFKALSRQAVTDLVPLVRDTGWFFDTELLLLAARNGYRIKEIPVQWTDDPDSRVKIVPTACEDIKGLIRLRFGGLNKASSRLSSARNPN